MDRRKFIKYLPAGALAAYSGVDATGSGAQPIYVSVITYGATGNGTSDDTAAIQNAINAVVPREGELFTSLQEITWFQKGSR